MQKSRLTWSIALAISVCSAMPAQGQNHPRAADEAAIREAARQFARAFESGDAAAVAAAFTEEAEYHDEENEPLRGRAAIQKAYSNLFANREKITVKGTSDAVTFLGKDTALEEGTFEVQNEGRPGTASRYSALFVRQDGKWQMALLKEWSDDSKPLITLNDLAWLIGSWESESPETKAHTTYEWSKNKTFIRSQFSIEDKKMGKAISSGTQVLGIDPTDDVLRAWTFGDEGGFGEAVWTWDGDQWVIESTGTLPEGQTTSAVNFLKPGGADEFIWRSVERTIDDEPQPDIGPVRVKRVAATR